MSAFRLRPRGNCLAFAFFSTSILGAAGAPTQVADLAQSLAARSSYPNEIYRVGEYVVFGASDPFFGFELHSFRPATSRTELLVDATPGTGGSQVVHAGEVAGRRFYWSGPIGRTVLYVTDGTSAGTREVVDRDGAQIALEYPRPTVVIGTRAVLQGNEAATGRAGLWAVDGDGKAERVWRGGDPESIWGPAIVSYAASRGRVTFLELPADDSGTAVWVTDGTSLGTRLVDTVDCFAEGGVATADHFLFVCRSFEPSGDHWALYSSDGTAGGTVRLGDWEAGAEERSPRLLGANAGRAYFETWSASWRASFWMTDGTVAGTLRLARAADWRSSGSDYPPVWFGEEFYFWAMDGEWPDSSYDYWSHDGSSAPPQRMRTGTLGEHSWTHSPIAVGDRLLFFSLDEAGAGEEIWAKQLGSFEVEQVSRFCPPDCMDFLSISGVSIGESALLYLGIHESMFGSSWMVARSDGTVEGTRALARSWEGEAQFSAGYPGGSAAVDGGYFVAGHRSPSGSEPWFVDEVTGSLHQLANLEPENASSRPTGLLSTGAELYFRAPGLDDTYGPWQVANSGTPRHLSPNGCIGSYSFRPSGVVGGRVLFEGDSGCLLAFDPLSETWETLVEESGGATVTGTVVASNGLAYFLRAGTRLWHTDGTPAGTVPMGTAAFDEPRTIVGVTSTHIYLWSDYYQSTLHSVGIGDGLAENLGDLSGWNLWQPQPTQESRVIGSRFFFTARTTSNLETLSSSTGHATETSVLWTSAIDERVFDLYELGGELYFVVAGERAALWRSDGTAAGTRSVADLGPLSADADDGRAHSGAALDGRLYFVSENAATGAELWSSDGTAAGTRLHDLVPGVVGSDPRELTVLAGLLYFSAADRAFGREVWAFDPAPGRASRAGDIADGPLSSVPEELTAVGSNLYFAADDGIHGRELWAIDTAAPPASCVASPGRLCLLEGQFEVEAFWRDFQGRGGRARATALAAGSAYFTFVEGAGAELLVKLVEVCAPSGYEETWIYAAGLTNLDVTLALRDTSSDERRDWHNDLGQHFQPRVAATTGAACNSALPASASTESAAPRAPAATLPLFGGRFVAEIDWTTSAGTSGLASAVALDDRSGYFWFFDAAYPEVLIRMVDACGFGGFDNFWVLAAGLTDVGVRLTLTDTWSGEEMRHENFRGQLFAPLLETGEPRVCAVQEP